MKIQLSIKDVMKSSIVVTYAVQILKKLHQLIFWVIKLIIDENRESVI